MPAKPCIAIALTLAALALSSAIQARSAPPAPSGACDLRATLSPHLPAPGHFAQLPGGTFAQAMLAPSRARRMGLHGPFGPRAVVTSWNGAAFDGCRMYFKGDGHHSYGGNEVYAYDFQALQFQRLNDPAPLSLTIRADCPIPDPRRGPYSGHTWDGLIHAAGKLFTWESAGFCRKPSKALNKLFAHGVFDIARRRWEQVAYRTDRHQVGTFVSVRPLGPFKAAFTRPDGSRGVLDWTRGRFMTAATARAPGGGIVILHPERGWVSAYVPQSGKVACPERALASGASGGVLVRVQDKLLYNGGVWGSRTRIRFHEIRFDRQGCPMPWRGPAAEVDLPPEARSSLPLWAKPMVWHPPSGTVVMWNGREQFWAFDPDDYGLLHHWSVALHPKPKVAGATPIHSKMHYIAELDAFAMYVNPDERMWLYRLPADLAEVTGQARDSR